MSHHLKEEGNENGDKKIMLLCNKKYDNMLGIEEYYQLNPVYLRLKSVQKGRKKYRQEGRTKIKLAYVTAFASRALQSKYYLRNI